MCSNVSFLLARTKHTFKMAYRLTSVNEWGKVSGVNKQSIARGKGETIVREYC